MPVFPLIFAAVATFADDYSVVALSQGLQAVSAAQPAGGAAAQAAAASVTERRETRWSGERLQCRYNPAGAMIPLAAMEAAIRAAGRAWELKSGLRFEYAGTTDDAPGATVRDCLISWDIFSNPFKLGQAQNYRVGSTFVGSDIRLSRLLDAGRLQMVLTHEIGHGLGLSHDEEGCIMRTSPDDAALCFSDYAGISYLYPPYQMDGRPALDCSVNILPGNEVYIPSIDGKYWARYKLDARLNLTYIEHGEIEAGDFFVCK